MKNHGFDPGSSFPDTSNLRFVMLDEFFPMLPSHKNSFCHYISVFYTSVLGIKDENVMTFDLVANSVLTVEELEAFTTVDVDLSLLTQSPTEADQPDRQLQRRILQKVQAFCELFEKRLEELGGIGFFLGGIGPDGHIAFNQVHAYPLHQHPLPCSNNHLIYCISQEGSSHDSITRLVNFNYPTAAAAAGDLGGIEVARGKAAMTIGLKTIRAKPSATIIIMAAGEGKASVVRAAIEEPADCSRPASSLHGHAGARFYITHGAGIHLTARRAEKYSKISEEVCCVCMTASTSFLTSPLPQAVDWAKAYTSAATDRPSLTASQPPGIMLLY